MPPGRANRSGWHSQPRANMGFHHQPSAAEYNRYLLSWPGRFNGSLTSRTHLFIKGNGIVDLPKLQRWSPILSRNYRCACLLRRRKRSAAPVEIPPSGDIVAPSNMTRRRRFAIKWSILTSAAGRFQLWRRANCLIAVSTCYIATVERSAYSALCNLASRR